MTEYRNRHLEAIIFFIGYIRLMRSIQVAHDNTLEHLTAKTGRASGWRCGPAGFLDRFACHVHDELEGFFRFQMETPRDEFVPVRVDKVARDIFPECQRGIPP